MPSNVPKPVNLAPLEVDNLESKTYEEQDYTYRPPSERPLPGLADHPTLAFWWANVSVLNDTGVSLTTYRRHQADGLVQVSPKDLPELAAARPDLVDGDRFYQDGQVLMAMPKKRAENRVRYYEDLVNQNLGRGTEQFYRDAKEDPRMPVEASSQFGQRMAKFSDKR